MQYLTNSTTSQSLMFTLPCDYDSTTKLKFTSYQANFEVTPTVTLYKNFLRCSFTLSSSQASYFESNSEFKVQFGTATDQVVGNTSPTTIIEYNG